MRIAFYAPLKPPDHPVPSGDRRVAELFLEALRIAGHQPVIASRIRSFDGAGNAARQTAIATAASVETQRLIAGWRRSPPSAPQLWFTYHLYHKAPDLIGPEIAGALAIPYVVAEASFAPKRAGGAWGAGHRAVARALHRADLVFGLNPADRACVLPLLRNASSWVALPPFLDAKRFRLRLFSAAGCCRLVATAMMRPGDKLASYRVLGQALGRLLDVDWTLEVVGDGPARPAVQAALAPLDGRVTYRGTLGEGEVAAALASADLFVWPAINEAFGMAMLEAQASGLPVIAGASGGVSEIVQDGVTGILTPPGDVGRFAAAVRDLIVDPPRRAAMGAAAREKVKGEHDLPVAAARIAAAIEKLAGAQAA